MARVLAVALIALAAVALYATTAPAGERAVTPKQFTALQKRVKALESDEKEIVTVLTFMIHCGFDQSAVATTKAPQYHATGEGETTDFYVLATSDQNCATIINSPTVRRLLERVR